MRVAQRCLATLAIVCRCLFSPLPASAIDLQHAAERPPVVQSEPGSTVDDVTIEIYGEVMRDIAQRYLALEPGALLMQTAIDHDYNNLLRLGGYRVRLETRAGSTPNSMTLHWIRDVTVV
jgi:hypothetical protein